jgi:DNA-binding transcriptional regulator YiaG
MRRWKQDIHGIGGLDYVLFLNVPMRESKWGDVIDLNPEIMEKIAAEALIKRRIPLRGLEVKFLRKSLGLTFEKFASELGVSASTVCKWEQKSKERLNIFNETTLRAFFAEHLSVEIPGKLSELRGIAESPEQLILKAS